MSANLAPVQQPDVGTPARASAVSYEDGIRRDTHENGRIIGPNGVAMANGRSGPRSVGFTGAQLRAAAGATLTHNHPSGAGFSREDVSLAIEFQLHEVRVVTRTHRFIANQFRGLQVSVFEAEYDRIALKVEADLRDEVRTGRLNQADYHSEFVDRAMQRAASALGFWYEKEQS